MTLARREMKEVFCLDDFADEVQEIVRRGRAVLSTMQKMGAPQERINQEEIAIGREILHCRIKTTARFGDALSVIIEDCKDLK
jgi:hypothetical protein